METQLTLHPAARQNDFSGPSNPSEGLSEIQASCRRLADAADAEIERALHGGGVNAEEFLRSAQQLRGGQ
ncbi:MAG: hypothetical protein ABSH08_18885 [Tepidisphaeraceae bacterium]|jgi:hypothetical protein